MPRGGRRAGKVGQAHANRSDLNPVPKFVPPPGSPYGQRKELAEAQRAVPMAPPPGPPPGQAPAGPPPAFSRPTERPDEPLTQGMPVGPGAGPEALGFGPKGDPDLEAMRPYLATLELLASLPNASSTGRAFVRRLRGSMPPEGQ